MMQGATIDVREVIADAGTGGIDILLVEDNPSYSELTLRALRETAGDDLRVKVAGTGELALQILLDEKVPQLPRLVILDINMPGIGGLEVLRRVREHPATRYLPVVMLTSSNLPSDIAESYRLGAYGYVLRPLNFQSYIRMLSDIIAYWLVINVSATAAA
jgi:two-component system response regulator